MNIDHSWCFFIGGWYIVPLLAIWCWWELESESLIATRNCLLLLRWVVGIAVGVVRLASKKGLGWQSRLSWVVGMECNVMWALAGCPVVGDIVLTSSFVNLIRNPKCSTYHVKWRGDKLEGEKIIGSTITRNMKLATNGKGTLTNNIGPEEQ